MSIIIVYYILYIMYPPFEYGTLQNRYVLKSLLFDPLLCSMRSGAIAEVFLR